MQMKLEQRPMAPEGDASLWAQRVGPFVFLPALIRQLGGDPVALLAGVGLGPDALDNPDARVPYRAICRLLENAASTTGCLHLGLLVGRASRLADLGLVGELTRNAPTVRSALHTLTVHQHMNSAGGLAFLIERDDFVDLGYAVYHPGLRRTDQICEASLAAACNIMRELCGAHWAPSAVLLPHAAPADFEFHRHFFRCRPRFNAELSALRFPTVLMDQPVEGADPTRYKAALREVRTAPRGDLIAEVHRALRLVLVHGGSSGDEVAKMLFMHRRTLNRRLRDHGTTFQRVLDQVRYDVSRQLLAGSDISLDDLAASLGYAGVSPFMRTFRRWSGTTPGRWRRAAALETATSSVSAAAPSGNGTATPMNATAPRRPVRTRVAA